MQKFVFGGFEAEVDPTDVAFVQRYEAAAEDYQAHIAAISKEGKASEVMMRLCEVFYQTLDALFGAGASRQMFGEVNSVDLCVQAFRQLTALMNDYGDTLGKLGIAAAPKRSRKKK